jgi:hypothetical protein
MRYNSSDDDSHPFAHPQGAMLDATSACPRRRSGKACDRAACRNRSSLWPQLRSGGGLHAGACRKVYRLPDRPALDRLPPLPAPDECPVTLAELLAEPEPLNASRVPSRISDCRHRMGCGLRPLARSGSACSRRRSTVERTRRRRLCGCCRSRCSWSMTRSSSIPVVRGQG